MTGAPWCPHDDDPHSCPPCHRDMIARERAVARDASRVFPAKFSGWCTGCSLPIYPGQQITLVDGAAFHEGCEP